MKNKTIYLAGGCFWGVERYFSLLKGVITTEVGYLNGNINNPTYQQVCLGEATHAEAVKIVYDGNLQIILDNFFKIINPFSLNRQGADIGIQYRTGIYYNDETDLPLIKEKIKEVENKYNKKVAVEVLKMNNYFKAEQCHQNYLAKNKDGYCHINLDLLPLEDRK